jgi:hypothetical protein
VDAPRSNTIDDRGYRGRATPFNPDERASGTAQPIAVRIHGLSRCGSRSRGERPADTTIDPGDGLIEARGRPCWPDHACRRSPDLRHARHAKAAKPAECPRNRRPEIVPSEGAPRMSTRTPRRRAGDQRTPCSVSESARLSRMESPRCARRACVSIVGPTGHWRRTRRDRQEAGHRTGSNRRARLPCSKPLESWAAGGDRASNVARFLMGAARSREFAPTIEPHARARRGAPRTTRSTRNGRSAEDADFADARG